MTARATLLAAYIVANASLYSALLPLWEGFDEPFHFGYVQQMANLAGFPDPRTSRLSRETAASISIAPASRPVQINLPGVRTYTEYFSLPRSERAALRAELEGIPPEWRRQSSGFVNYEGQQAPLAYILLALPERAMARVPLLRRVLALRIAAALCGAFLLYAGAEALFRELALRGAYKEAALFCIFSSQALWAAIAHIGNDWLAIPLAVWSLVAAIHYERDPETRTALWMGVALSLGLLTKAYFLAFAPLPAILCAAKKRPRDLWPVSAVVLAAAGPWYARNLLLYGTLLGTTQSRAGIGPLAALQGAPALNWPRIVWASIRSALWTGNNTFLAFSVTTETAIAAVWLVALILWARTKHGGAERIAALHCGLFIAALGCDAAIQSLYLGRPVGTAPWYSQVLLAPMLGLAFLGCGRVKRVGRAVAAGLAGLSGYMLIATYPVKLIPLYGGFEGKMTAGRIAALYSARLPELTDRLNTAALAPAGILLSLAAVVCALAIAQMAALAKPLN